MDLSFVVLILAVCIHASEATLSCLSCSNVRNTSECTNSITCQQNEKCYTTTSGQLGNRLFSLGCKAEKECNGGSMVAGLIGRKKRAAPDSNCHQCCAVDNCNSELCAQIDQVTGSSTETCEDDPAIDCAHLSRVIQVCADVHHAKTICKKWCGFCGLFDGDWSDWAAWSSCSVTCNDGYMTRTRTCTDPAPSHGGHDCVGASSDSMTCHHSIKCPVNGGWGAWLPWDACSVSYGNGFRRRKRLCNNPSPDNNGQHCFGDVHDIGSCHMKQPNVTFYMKDAQRLEVATGDTILYNTALWDTSGSYNSSTGVFTAPVAGLYVFTVTVCAVPKHHIGLQIQTTSGQGQLGELIHLDDDHYTTSTMTGVGELQAGSQVWVQCLYAYGAGNDLYDSPSDGEINSFQGTLIRVL